MTRCESCGRPLPHPPQPDSFEKWNGIPNLFDLWFIITDKGAWVSSLRNGDEVFISFMETMRGEKFKRIMVLSKSEFFGLTNEQRINLILKANPNAVVRIEREIKKKKQKSPNEVSKLNPGLAAHHEKMRSVKGVINQRLAESVAFLEVSQSISDNGKKKSS